MGEEWEARDIPEAMASEAEDARHQLIDVVSNFDDIIMEKYLAEEEITADDLRRALRTATLAAEVVPVLCGSAFKNKGVQPMLDAVVDYLPSPLDLPPTQGTGPSQPEEIEERKADDSEPFAALAFKIMTDPYVGKLTYLRVYSGTLRKGATVTNSTKDKKERIGPHPPDARQPPRGQGRHLRRRHRGRGRPQADHHRRHPVRPGPPDRARGAGVPRAGHPRGRRAQDQGRPGQALQGPVLALRGGPRPSGSARTRRPARRSSRAWASSTSRCWSTACCASSAWTPTWASPRWPTARPSASRSRRSRSSTSARPVAGASTATWSSASSPPGPAEATSSWTRSPAG